MGPPEARRVALSLRTDQPPRGVHPHAHRVQDALSHNGARPCAAPAPPTDWASRLRAHRPRVSPTTARPWISISTKLKQLARPEIAEQQGDSTSQWETAASWRTSCNPHARMIWQTAPSALTATESPPCLGSPPPKPSRQASSSGPPAPFDIPSHHRLRSPVSCRDVSSMSDRQKPGSPSCL